MLFNFYRFQKLRPKGLCYYLRTSGSVLFFFFLIKNNKKNKLHCICDLFQNYELGKYADTEKQVVLRVRASSKSKDGQVCCL